RHCSTYFLSRYSSITEIYPLSLHDALPILLTEAARRGDVAINDSGIGYGRLPSSVFSGDCRMHTQHTVLSHNCRQEPTMSTRAGDRKSTRLNSSHVKISYAVFCLKEKKNFR